MFKGIIEALSPAMATSGVQHYWKGNYVKSERRLSKALRMSPGVVLNSAFEGYLGLSLFKLGQSDKAKQHLLSAQKYLSNSNVSSSSIIEIEKTLSSEIDEALNEYKT